VTVVAGIRAGPDMRVPSRLFHTLLIGPAHSGTITGDQEGGTGR
jgi:hypothetical protein